MYENSDTVATLRHDYGYRRSKLSRQLKIQERPDTDPPQFVPGQISSICIVGKSQFSSGVQYIPLQPSSADYFNLVQTISCWTFSEVGLLFYRCKFCWCEQCIWSTNHCLSVCLYVCCRCIYLCMHKTQTSSLSPVVTGSGARHVTSPSGAGWMGPDDITPPPL